MRNDGHFDTRRASGPSFPPAYAATLRAAASTLRAGADEVGPDTISAHRLRSIAALLDTLCAPPRPSDAAKAGGSRKKAKHQAEQQAGL